MADFSVRVDGLRDLRKDLKALGKEANRGLTGDLKEALRPVATRAAAFAPKRTGRLAASVKPFAAGNRAGLRSNLPYANPIHWGWRAHGITAQPFALQAVERSTERIVDSVGDAIEGHARRHGWK